MSKKLNKSLLVLTWIAIAIAAIVLVRMLKIYDICCTIVSLVSPIFFGYIFAWLLKPIHDKLSKRSTSRIGVGILIGVFVLIYALAIWKLVPIVIDNFDHVFSLIQEYIEKLKNLPYLKDLKDIPKVDFDVLISSCGSIISIVVQIVLIHVFGFYMLFNYNNINKFVKNLIPKKYKKLSLEYTKKLSTNMRSYIRGTIFDTLILFVISSILYAIIGLKYPIMLALFSAITNIIPFVGPYIGGIPAVLVGLSKSFNLGLITVGVIVLAQTIESNIINPMIMSKCIKVNPLLIVIALTIMGRFLGLVGMIFAVPILIVLKLSCEFIRKYKDIIRIQPTKKLKVQ